LTSAPPGFGLSDVVRPPPGFQLLPSAPPSFIYLSSYAQAKDAFRGKLNELFDNDRTLCNEYETFCQAYYDKTIDSMNFIRLTRELLKEKFDEYLMELIVLTPNIEQQNELYDIWQCDRTSSSAVSTNNWTTTNAGPIKTIHRCHLCQQIVFDVDVEQHNSHHTEFNAEYPSLPSAAVSFGRVKGNR
jgi:hypothetical protein